MSTSRKSGNRKVAIGRAFAAACAAIAVSIVPAQGTVLVSAGSGEWTNTATWTPAQVPTIADDAAITGGHVVAISDKLSHEVGSLIIRTNGVLTHRTNVTVEAHKIILHITNSLSIDLGGAIDVDGRGYMKGAPLWVDNDFDGGSYGGRGGGDTGSRTYGSLNAPTNLGANGGSDYWYSQGGGAVILTVDGASTIDGLISACGTNRGYSAGAGGSIFLTTATLAGSGIVRVNGGNKTTYGSGGGGRMAVILTAGNGYDNVRFQAYGGNDGLKGGAGTIYRQTAAQGAGNGELIIDNNDLAAAADAATAIPDGATWDTNLFDTLVLTNNGILGIWTNTTLNINGMTARDDPSAAGEGLYLNRGTLATPAAYAFPYRVWIRRASTFSPGTSVTVQSNGILQIDVPFVFGREDLIVAGGGIVTHYANTTAEANKLILTVSNNLTIATNGAIDVDGKGYESGGSPYTAADYRDGGSYGGRGGHDTTSPTYGSVLAPTNLGTGGGEWVGRAAPGGGAARLVIQGTTTVYGAITAGGTSYGSGGSVYLTTGHLKGNGTIRANGAAPGGATLGAGGGGRIAVILTSGADGGQVAMQAYGGNQNNYDGGAGTVYFQTAAQAQGAGTVTIDNDSVTPGSAAGYNEIPPFTNAAAGEILASTLIVTNLTKSLVANNFTVGNLYIYSGATVDLQYLTITVNSVCHPLGGGATNNPGAIIWTGGGGTMFQFQ